jgi:hypothetical protein
MVASARVRESGHRGRTMLQVNADLYAGTRHAKARTATIGRMADDHYADVSPDEHYSSALTERS